MPSGRSNSASSVVNTPKELSVTNLNIPHEYVSLKSFHEGDNGKTLIHIQDAHSNYSGQKNIAHTLKELIQEYDINTILVEGGYGDVTLNELKTLASNKDWDIMANKFLMKSLITGPEYLNLTTDLKLKLLGLEDKELYENNVLAYSFIKDKRLAIKHYLHTIQISLNRLKNKLYPKELLKYEKNKDPTDFTSNFKELLSLIDQTELKSLFSYPNIKKLKDLQLKEDSLNFPMINQDQMNLWNNLKKVYPKDKQDELSKYFESTGSNHYTKRLLLEELLTKAKEYRLRVTQYPHLLNYLLYLEEFNQLKTDTLLDELESLEDHMYGHLLEQVDTKKLRAIDRYLQLVRKAYDIKLSNHDYKMLVHNEPIFKTKLWITFLNQKLNQANYKDNLLDYKPLLEDSHQNILDFYSLVQQRDTKFIENTNKHLKEKDKAFIITGGYHTENLTHLLKQEGYSLITLTPNITHETDQHLYEKVLLSSIHKTPKTKPIVLAKAKPQDYVAIPATKHADASRISEMVDVAAGRLPEDQLTQVLDGARTAEVDGSRMSIQNRSRRHFLHSATALLVSSNLKSQETRDPLQTVLARSKIKSEPTVLDADRAHDFTMVADANTAIEALLLDFPDDKPDQSFEWMHYLELIESVPKDVPIIVRARDSKATHEKMRRILRTGLPDIVERLRFIPVDWYGSQWTRDNMSPAFNPSTNQFTFFKGGQIIPQHLIGRSLNVVGNQFKKNSWWPRWEGGEFVSDQVYMFLPESSDPNLDQLDSKEAVRIPVSGHGDLVMAALGKTTAGDHTVIVSDPLMLYDILRGIPEKDKAKVLKTFKDSMPDDGHLAFAKEVIVGRFQKVLYGGAEETYAKHKEDDEGLRKINALEKALKARGFNVVRVPGTLPPIQYRSYFNMNSAIGLFYPNVVQFSRYEDGIIKRGVRIPKYHIDILDNRVRDIFIDLGFDRDMIKFSTATFHGNLQAALRCTCQVIGRPMPHVIMDDEIRRTGDLSTETIQFLLANFSILDIVKNLNDRGAPVSIYQKVLDGGLTGDLHPEHRAVLIKMLLRAGWHADYMSRQFEVGAARLSEDKLTQMLDGARTAEVDGARFSHHSEPRMGQRNLYSKALKSILKGDGELNQITPESVERWKLLKRLGPDIEKIIQEVFRNNRIKIAIAPYGSTLKGYASGNSDIEFMIMVFQGLPFNVNLMKDESYIRLVEEAGTQIELLFERYGYDKDDMTYFFHDFIINYGGDENLVDDYANKYRDIDDDELVVFHPGGNIAPIFLPVAYGDPREVEYVRRYFLENLPEDVDWKKIQDDFEGYLLIHTLRVPFDQSKPHLSVWLRDHGINSGTLEEINDFDRRRIELMGLPSYRIMKKIYKVTGSRLANTSLLAPLSLSLEPSDLLIESIKKFWEASDEIVEEVSMPDTGRVVSIDESEEALEFKEEEVVGMIRQLLIGDDLTKVDGKTRVIPSWLINDLIDKGMSIQSINRLLLSLQKALGQVFIFDPNNELRGQLDGIASIGIDRLREDENLMLLETKERIKELKGKGLLKGAYHVLVLPKGQINKNQIIFQIFLHALHSMNETFPNHLRRKGLSPIYEHSWTAAFKGELGPEDIHLSSSHNLGIILIRALSKAISGARLIDQTVNVSA